MFSNEHLHHVVGREVVDSTGTSVGRVGGVYVDDTTGRPAWVTVRTGLFGSSESFVPLDEATMDGDVLSVPYSRDRVGGAPRLADDGHLAPEQEAELYRYYGLAHSGDDGRLSGGDLADDLHRDRHHTLTTTDVDVDEALERVTHGDLAGDLHRDSEHTLTTTDVDVDQALERVTHGDLADDPHRDSEHTLTTTDVDVDQALERAEGHPGHEVPSRAPRETVPGTHEHRPEDRPEHRPEHHLEHTPEDRPEDGGAAGGLKARLRRWLPGDHA